MTNHEQYRAGLRASHRVRCNWPHLNRRQCREQARNHACAHKCAEEPTERAFWLGVARGL